MCDQHDRVAWMAPHHLAQCRNGAGENLLQRFAIRDRRPIRMPVPGVELSGPAGARLVRGQPLPVAVIDVVEARHRRCRQAEWVADRRAGIDAAPHRTIAAGRQLAAIYAAVISASRRPCSVSGSAARPRKRSGVMPSTWPWRTRISLVMRPSLAASRRAWRAAAVLPK